MFVSGHKCEPQHVVHQPPATHIPLQGCSCPLQVVPSVSTFPCLILGISMWRYNGLHLRFLSWAFHVFAYDLAYEPDGWPWRQVRHISNLLFPPNLSDWILCGAHPGAGGFRDLIHRSKQCQMSSFISSPTHILCHRFNQLFHPAFPYFLSLRLKTLKLF